MSYSTRRVRAAAIAAVLLSSLATASPAASPQTLPETAAHAKAAGSQSDRLDRDGVVVDFDIKPIDGRKRLVEGGDAEVRFRVTDSTSKQPIPGLAPGAWLDLGQVIAGKGGEQKDCRDKIALYLKGVVGIRPMLDLNGYYLLVMNQGASITVIDPVVSVAGTTSTLTTVVLKKPPMDWVKSPDGKRLFVTMPAAGQVAVVDTARFRVETDIAAGRNPVRIALQPDGRYLWVGNNNRGATSGVTVIDSQSLKIAGVIETGDGHHEIAFSRDSRRAYVTSRDAGTVTVVDTGTLAPIKTIATGKHPLAIAWSDSANAVYVADGATGTVTVIDDETLRIRKTLQAKPGLGPLRFAPDGRHAIVLNTAEHTARVIDAATDEFVNTIDVAAEPYQIMYTRTFAYVRGLSSERVTMINLGTIGKGKKPTIQSFPAGAAPPRNAGDLPIADAMTQAKDDAAIFAVNPVDNNVYFYMEGMNAPMGGYVNRGFAARAVTVVDRSMREVEPGVFATQVRWPAAGKYDVAFMLDRPRILHCFAAEVIPDPVLAQKSAKPRAKLMLAQHKATQGDKVLIRIGVREGKEDRPRDDVADVTLRYFLAPSSPAQHQIAKHVGGGIYEAEILASRVGAYYLYASIPSLGIGVNDQPFATLRVTAAKAAQKGGSTQ